MECNQGDGNVLGIALLSLHHTIFSGFVEFFFVFSSWDLDAVSIEMGCNVVVVCSSRSTIRVDLKSEHRLRKDVSMELFE